MQHEVAPALARKFGEPGGLFDTVLQRLVSEWHRYQVDRDPRRLTNLHEILEAGLAQLRSLELLLRTDREDEATADPVLTDPQNAEGSAARAVYAVHPAPEPSDAAPTQSAAAAVVPSRMNEAMRLLDALHDALGEALGSPTASPHSPTTPDTVPLPSPPGAGGSQTEPLQEEARAVAGNGSGRLGRPTDGVFSHEAFDVASAAELKRCRRFERAFSLLLLDPGLAVDPQADQMILGNLREFDLVGRYGNGVLAIGLPETTDDGARLIGHRLVALLSRQGAWADGGRLGIASYPKDGNTLTTVVRSARSHLGGAACS
jgi:hypothetical protein